MKIYHDLPQGSPAMTREEYRAHPALNFSLAKYLLKSPAHFRAAVDEEREETDAMRIGTLAHSMILEGKNLIDMYAIKPEGMSFATKEGKAWRDAQTLPILKEEDANSIPRIAEAIAENIDARALLEGCTEREFPVFATMHGVECKALIDAAGLSAANLWCVGDFKTSVDVTPRKFSSTVYDMDYDMQAAWSSDLLALVKGLDHEPWWFWIAAEKKPPFANAVYTPSDKVMESGRKKVERALTIYKQCIASGEWPMPMRGIQIANLPKWAEFGEVTL